MLFACACLTGCKKEFTQSVSVRNAAMQVGNNSSCKVTQIVWAYWYPWDFHYNEKGLADEWRIDFGFGNVQNYKMKYDKFDKLVEAPGYDDFNNLIITNYFTYSDKHIISQKWADLRSGSNGETCFPLIVKGK